MIGVDIAEIEKLTDTLVKMASDSDEVLSRLRQVCSEMYNDVELPAYPQSAIALDAISAALDALNKGNDMLLSLKSIMLPVASMYQENEQRNKEALNRLTARMDSVSVGYNAAIVSDNIVHVEQTDNIVLQGKVQQLVTDSFEEPQVTNIAAVTNVIRQEYEISKIEDLVEKA